MIKSRIKYYLDKNNMTQRELAEKTGMTETSISRYVSGIRIPRATECIEIAKVLGCKAEDLFIKVDEESAKEPVCEWARITGISRRTLQQMINNNNLTLDEAFTNPVNHNLARR